MRRSRCAITLPSPHARDVPGAKVVAVARGIVPRVHARKNRSMTCRSYPCASGGVRAGGGPVSWPIAGASAQHAVGAGTGRWLAVAV